MKHLPYNANVHRDARQLFRFDAIKYVPTVAINKDGSTHDTTTKVSLGWSLSIYADDRRDAIKRFVAMTSPTTRFEIVDMSATDAEQLAA